MPIVDKATLKTYFEAGDIPTEEQYEDLIDTIFSRAASPIVNIEVQAAGVPILGTGPLPGFFTVPSAYNGKSIDTVACSVKSTPAGGTVQFEVQKNGVAFSTLNIIAGATQVEGTGLAEAIATGDQITVEIVSNAATTPAEGFNVLLILDIS